MVVSGMWSPQMRNLFTRVEEALNSDRDSRLPTQIFKLIRPPDAIIIFLLNNSAILLDPISCNSSLHPTRVACETVKCDAA